MGLLSKIKGKEKERKEVEADDVVKYRHLSWSLKIAIIIAYIIGFLNLLYFLVGFMIGITGT